VRYLNTWCLRNPYNSSGYIDLSKRRVSPEDIVKCEERYNKSKMVFSIMRHVAEKTKTPIEELYEKIGWPLNKKYGHAVDAFKLSITYACFSYTTYGY
jgi:translation initiation factor 2 subunit 1